MASKTLKQPAEQGFTIIEVLFVLAIAGLIMLIVFMAIPALQRSSRNNQRRQDIQIVLEAVSHWELNHAGAMPAQTDTYLQHSSNKLSYYDPAAIKLHQQSRIAGSPDAAANLPAKTGADATTSIDVYNYEKCKDDASGAAVIQGAGYNDVVALYAIETSSGFQSQCRDL